MNAMDLVFLNHRFHSFIHGPQFHCFKTLSNIPCFIMSQNRATKHWCVSFLVPSSAPLWTNRTTASCKVNRKSLSELNWFCENIFAREHQTFVRERKYLCKRTQHFCERMQISLQENATFLWENANISARERNSFVRERKYLCKRTQKFCERNAVFPVLR